MIRVLHVDLTRGYRGGQRQLLLLAEAQITSGLDVLVLCRSVELGARLREAAVPTAAATPWRVKRELLAASIAHAHDARAHGLLAALGARALVVHRRIDDPPRPRLLTRWKYQRGTFVCVSHAVSAVLEQFGVPEGRRSVVHSGVPIPAPHPRKPRAGRSLRALCLGALVEHKGHADLLRALATGRAVARLDIVGDGPLRDALQGSTGAAHARFLGDPRGALPDFGAYDLLIQPSRTEGLGTAVLDAQAAGLPVLATTAGGLPEAVAPSGWLVPPRAPDALATALRGIAELPADELSRRGDAARRWTTQRFSVQTMERSIARIYARVESRA